MGKYRNYAKQNVRPRGHDNSLSMFKAVQQPDRFLDRPSRPQVEFETWIQLFDVYASLSGLNERPEKPRRNTFVRSLGRNATEYI